MILSNVHCQSILSLQLDCKNINTKSIFLIGIFLNWFLFYFNLIICYSATATVTDSLTAGLAAAAIVSDQLRLSPE